MSNLVILDTTILLEKEFKLALKSIFGFSYIKLRHLIYKVQDLTASDRNSMSFYLPELALFGSDLKKKISVEQEKFFTLKCYRRNRLLLGLPAHGQRTHSNAEQLKDYKLNFKWLFLIT